MGALNRFHDLLVSITLVALSVFAMVLLVLLGDPTFREGFHIHLIPEAIALFAMGFSLGTAADLFSWPRKTGWSIVITIYSTIVVVFSIWNEFVYTLLILLSSLLLLGYGVQRILNANACMVMINAFFIISAMIVASLTFLGIFFVSSTISLTITQNQRVVARLGFFLSTLLALFCSLIVFSHLIFFSKRIKPSG